MCPLSNDSVLCELSPLLASPGGLGGGTRSPPAITCWQPSRFYCRFVYYLRRGGHCTCGDTSADPMSERPVAARTSGLPTAIPTGVVIKPFFSRSRRHLFARNTGERSDGAQPITIADCMKKVNRVWERLFKTRLTLISCITDEFSSNSYFSTTCECFS